MDRQAQRDSDLLSSLKDLTAAVAAPPGNHATAETQAHQPLRERQEVQEQAQPRLRAHLFSRGPCVEKTLVACELSPPFIAQDQQLDCLLVGLDS